jgi:hypothetical protein
LLWGDPEYTRRFVESTHLYNGEGYEVNEPLATKMETQPQDAIPFDLINTPYRYYDYEFERYWHFFQVFGRIGYDPNTSSDIWDHEFNKRFGKQTGPLIQEALHRSSWILPRIVASCYPYSKFPTTRGWAEKQRLGDLPDYALAEGSDLQQFVSFDEEAELLITKGESARMRPQITSRWFEKTSDKINELVGQAVALAGTAENKELNSTITDLKILSNLALYHARRIPAAVSYRLFERTRDIHALDDAIKYEGQAIDAWRNIVTSAGDMYALDLMMGVREAQYMQMTHRQRGHWKDELVLLQEGLEKLIKMRKTRGDHGPISETPKYTPADGLDFDDLFKINHQPVTEVKLGEAIEVNISIDAPAGIKWVKLRYRSVNQHEDYQTLPMLSNDGKNFRATVPSDHVKPTWDFMYLIEIMDQNSNGRIYPNLEKETPYIIAKLERPKEK